MLFNRKCNKSDFCLVSSYEQREVFLKFNKNLFVYYMIPNFDSYSVVHKKKTQPKIFYHGNKIHLNTSYYGLTPALNQLGEKYNIEFNAIYNIDKLGKWRIGRPDQKLCY